MPWAVLFRCAACIVAVAFLGWVALAIIYGQGWDVEPKWRELTRDARRRDRDRW